jgi:hypothetical protein
MAGKDFQILFIDVRQQRGSSDSSWLPIRSKIAPRLLGMSWCYLDYPLGVSGKCYCENGAGKNFSSIVCARSPEKTEPDFWGDLTAGILLDGFRLIPVIPQ